MKDLEIIENFPRSEVEIVKIQQPVNTFQVKPLCMIGKTFQGDAVEKMGPEIQGHDNTL